MVDARLIVENNKVLEIDRDRSPQSKEVLVAEVGRRLTASGDF